MSAIHDKIRKLLAMAEGQANENESAQAMKLASALMMKHGIDQSDIRDPDKVIEGSWFDVDHQWQRLCASASGELYGTVPFYSHNRKTFRYAGRPENVDASQDTLAFILLQVDQLYKHHLPKGMSKQERAEYRRTFKLSCAMRVLRRAQDIVKEQCSVDGDNTPSGSTALVIVAHREQLEAEVNEHLNAAGATSRKTRPLSVKLTRGSVEGFAAGDNVDLNHKVG